MKTKFSLFHLLMIFIFITVYSCKDNDSDNFTISEKNVIVDSLKVTAQNPISTEELLYFRIKYESNSDVDWMLVYRIKNFEYEEGYEYVIKVREKILKNPLQDQEAISYEFLELISKKKY